MSAIAHPPSVRLLRFPGAALLVVVPSLFAGLVVSEQRPERTQARHVIEVASEFAKEAEVNLGGRLSGDALELPESNPAHIFRLNPSDRFALTSSTTKADYFLEDPYEPRAPNGALVVTPGLPDGATETLVFFIDGNLWIDSWQALSVRLEGPKRLELVVVGNIYISDDLEPAAGMEVRLYALPGEQASGSGAIVVGDPRFGTLSPVDDSMFAAGRVEYRPGTALADACGGGTGLDR